MKDYLKQKGYIVKGKLDVVAASKVPSDTMAALEVPSSAKSTVFTAEDQAEAQKTDTQSAEHLEEQPKPTTEYEHFVFLRNIWDEVLKSLTQPGDSEAGSLEFIYTKTNANTAPQSAIPDRTKPDGYFRLKATTTASKPEASPDEATDSPSTAKVSTHKKPKKGSPSEDKDSAGKKKDSTSKKKGPAHDWWDIVFPMALKKAFSNDAVDDVSSLYNKQPLRLCN